MPLPPSGSILVKKVDGNSNFVEDVLSSDDITPLLGGGFVLTTGNQTVSGVKNFATYIQTTAIANSGVYLPIGTITSHDVSFFRNNVNVWHMINGAFIPHTNKVGSIGNNDNMVASVHSPSVTSQGEALVLNSTTSTVQVRANNTAWWNFTTGGSFTPVNNDSQSIGSTTARVDSVVARTFTNASTSHTNINARSTGSYVLFNLGPSDTTYWRIEAQSVGGHFAPGANNSYDVGISGLMVRNVSAAKLVRVDGGQLTLSASGGTILHHWSGQDKLLCSGNFVSPSTALGLNLGSSGVAWNGLSTRNVESPSTTGLNISTINGQSLFIVHDDVTWWQAASGHIVPAADGAQNIGSPTNRLNAVYANNLIGPASSGFVDLSSNQTIGGTKSFTTSIVITSGNLILAATGEPILGPNGAAIAPNTSDGSDNKILALCGGSTASRLRGSHIDVRGNETSVDPGHIYFNTGSVAGSDFQFVLGQSDSEFRILETDGIIDLWRFDNSGNIIYSTNFSNIRANTSDGSDNKSFLVCGGGTTSRTRGATMEVRGNEHSSGGGNIEFALGNATGSDFIIVLGSTTSEFRILDEPGTTDLWRFDNNGAIIYSNASSAIRADSSDGSDTRSFSIAGGGTVSRTRGSYINVRGNEIGTDPGHIYFSTGNVAGSDYQFGLGSTTSEFRIIDEVGTLDLWKFENTGTFKYGVTNAVVGSDTSDASDNKSIYLCGGGTNSTSRGAFVQLAGNEHGSTGQALVSAGSVTGAYVRLQTSGDHEVQIVTSGLARAQYTGAGQYKYKKHSGYTDSDFRVDTVAINTTDASSTLLYSNTLSDNTSYNYRVKLIGRYNSTTAKSYWADLTFGVYRNNAGSATLIGTRVRIEDSVGSPGYSADVAVTGNEVRVNVTGAASETVSWVAVVEQVAVSTSA